MVSVIGFKSQGKEKDARRIQGCVWDVGENPLGGISNLFPAGKLAQHGCSGWVRLQGWFGLPGPPGHASPSPSVLPREAISILVMPRIPPCGSTRWRCAQRQPRTLPGGQRGLPPTLWAGSPILSRPRALRKRLVEEDTPMHPQCTQGFSLLSHQACTPHSPAHTGSPNTPNPTALREHARQSQEASEGSPLPVPSSDAHTHTGTPLYVNTQSCLLQSSAPPLASLSTSLSPRPPHSPLVGIK